MDTDKFDFYIDNKIFSDSRGSLLPISASDLPFEIKRVFVISDVPQNSVRGEHSHFATSQYLVCLKGSCKVRLDDGATKREFVLDSPHTGVLQRPLIWGEMYGFSAGAVLLVIASHQYDPSDYIEDYDEFLRVVKS